MFPPVTDETALGSQRGCWIGVDRFGTGVWTQCFRALTPAQLDLGICPDHLQELRQGGDGLLDFLDLVA